MAEGGSLNTAEGGYRIAVVGATGSVGAALLTVLEEREFPVARLQLLGRGDEFDEDEGEARSAVFANRNHQVRPLATFDFDDIDLAFFCVPAAVAATEVPRATAAGCRVVDCSAAFRASSDVPLVVAGVNDAAIAGARLVASPDAAVVQAAAVLGPLAREVGVTDVVLHTQLAVSDYGKAAVAELAGQTARLLNVQALKESVFPAQIAFNVISPLSPGVAGDSRREAAMVAELRRLLDDPGLAITASLALVPVFYGHSQVVSFQPRRPVAPEQLQKLLAGASGVELLDSDAESLSPVADSHGGDVVVVGRSRVDPVSGRVTLWTVADNVRKGAAVNSTEIARALLKPHP